MQLFITRVSKVLADAPLTPDVSNVRTDFEAAITNYGGEPVRRRRWLEAGKAIPLWLAPEEAAHVDVCGFLEGHMEYLASTPSGCLLPMSA